VDDFSVHADRLSAEADTRLGDLIQYAIAGASGGDYVTMKARLATNEQPISPRGFARMDEAQSGWRLRIAAALVPHPKISDRIKCAAILGDAVYRPVAADPVRDGRYWLVDLQKV
jgi:hypothetical protein